MASTSPDNIFSPNGGQLWNLTSDWQQTAESVQTALNKVRDEITPGARAFSGSSAERMDFLPLAQEGDSWQDTEGGWARYVKRNGSWEASMYAVVPFLNPFSAYSAVWGPGALVSRQGDIVTVQGAASVSDSINLSASNPFFNVPSWATPSYPVSLGIKQGSGEAIWNFQITADGSVYGERYRPSSTSSNIWLPFSGTYSVASW